MTTAILDATPDTLAERLFLRALERKPIDRLALRALMKAQRLLSLALGQRLMELRASEDPAERELAGMHASIVLVHLLREAVDLLGARIDKLPPRQRPHYTPVQRFRILQLIQLAGISREEAAKLFRIALNTLSDWSASANPDTKTVGSTVKPTPPVRRYNDTVHHLAQAMAGFGFTGYGDIVRHLARAGWRVARTTVRRYVKAPKLPSPGSQAPETPKRPVVARYPHHVWHLDLTEVPAFLGSAPRLLALLLHSASRLPVAATLFLKKPNAEDMLAFVEPAFARVGKPRYLIVDQDGCFTATAFKERIDAWRVRLRFCSADHHRANAKIERFWGTLKNTLLRLDPPIELLAPAELEGEIDRALRYYAFHRPHSGLGGATPAEAYHGLDPVHLTAGSLRAGAGVTRPCPCLSPSSTSRATGDCRSCARSRSRSPDANTSPANERTKSGRPQRRSAPIPPSRTNPTASITNLAPYLSPTTPSRPFVCRLELPLERHRDPPVPLPVAVEFLDGDRRFPYLHQAA